MPDELQELRRRTYSTAATFYKAQSKYFTVLRSARPREEIKQAAESCLTAGTRYAGALDELLSRLRSLGPDPGITQEVGRTERRKELLSAELDAIAPR